MTSDLYKTLTAALLVGAALSLSACGAGERLANVGKAPDMTPIANPITQEGYQAVSLPMPTPSQARREKNSLWASDRQTFFEDQRAGKVGDILTVVIDIADEATVENESARSRSSSESAGIDNLLGLETELDRYLPQAIVPGDLINADGNSNFSGTGSTEREEEISVKLAALVTQVLPNGNMVIQGRQEVRVNFEKRILELAGVIRPQDISVENTISYEKIAEARISYGGKGQITDYQQPRYGQQVFDVLMPF